MSFVSESIAVRVAVRMIAGRTVSDVLTAMIAGGREQVLIGLATMHDNIYVDGEWKKGRKTGRRK